MPKLYAVFAIMEDPHRIWPVAWSVDLGPLLQLQKACIDQATKLGDALAVVWRKMEGLASKSTIHQREREKLEAEEAAISRKHTDLMYDALFPVGNEGWLPEGWLPAVKYVIWPLAEDMRADFTSPELFLMRAQLHATEQSDSYLTDLGAKEDG